MLKPKNSEALMCANTNRASIEKTREGIIDMNSLQNNSLTFHSTTFSYMEMGGQIWLTAAEVGQALGYTDDKAIHRLYRKHADEFTVNMTGVVKVTTPGGVQDSRVFSLRGAHLMGMFSRTTVAKEFRRWVLDILDREVAHSPIAKQFTDEEIINLCALQLWMDDAQSVSKELHPAMKAIGSSFSAFFHDLGIESKTVTTQTKPILLREAEKLSGKIVNGREAEGMLAMLRQNKRIH